MTVYGFQSLGAVHGLGVSVWVGVDDGVGDKLAVEVAVGCGVSVLVGEGDGLGVLVAV